MTGTRVDVTRVVDLEEVIITDALARRPTRDPDHRAESAALRELARATARDPGAVPEILVRLARQLCQAGTAGLSLLDRDERGEEVFRWVALAGALAHAVGGTVPRGFSPCGTCLDRGSPQLYARPARHFTDLAPADIVEGLVLPFVGEQGPLGTIWVVAHDEGRRFDAEDVRLLTSLGDVAAAVHERGRVQERAEAALAVRDRFLSIVSHDLRNLLSVVLMNSVMLVRHAAGAGQPEVMRWAERTRAASDQMSRLVHALLDSAAIEAGRLELARERVDAAALLREAAAGVEPLAAPRRVALLVPPAAGADVVVDADPGRLRQVLDNLLTNAIKHSPPGGTVTLDLAGRPEEVVVSVRDEGPGIDPEQVPRLFERFAPGRQGGHGLGLWICRELVEAHGGRIGVETLAGAGSTFHVALPRRAG
ncbi:MAG: GAF domain-containing sensor histidine kinase [Planctomycetes bacterium]|nr:GAF domain-containing sensor histidine kinase [Planctomycetota bacterium]